MLKTIAFKEKFMISVAVFLALAVLMAAVLSFTGFVPVRADAGGNQPTKRTINATGTGKVTVAPDIAFITLGVMTQDKDAKLAQQANAKAMDKVVSLIKAAGVKALDIKTVNFSIYPNYSYNKDTGESTITGYVVNNSVQVTVRDISKAGAIIDIAADSGINIASGINFGLSDPDKYYNEALKKALESAKLKAASMAGVFGIKLGVPVTINENGGYSPPVIYNPVYAKAEDAAATPVQAGTMDISANVSVVYEY